MRLGPPSRLLLILALLLAIAGPSGVAAGAPATAPEPEHPRLQSGTVEPNETVLELVVDADGDARWTVTHSFDLADENDTRAFDRLAGEFERGEVGGRYLATMERAREAASETTGREMAIRNVSREATVVNGTGRLTTTFTWTSFARASGDTLRIGDAFRLPSGSWLPGLASDERLVVAPPDGYRIDSAPSADSFRNGSLVWEGPTEFESDYLSITYREVTAPPSPQSGTNGTETPLPGFFEEWLLPVVGGAFAIGLLALVAYLFVREEGPSGPAVEMNGGVDADDGTEPSAAEPDGKAGPAEPAEPESGADPDSGSKPPDEDEGDVDPELLSDEERVERLLERNGGRMKQANIVKETNWSNAKVSQLLSSMDEEGRIDKLRIGRENLITLPGEEPGEFTE